MVSELLLGVSIIQQPHKSTGYVSSCKLLCSQRATKVAVPFGFASEQVGETGFSAQYMEDPRSKK